MRYFTRPAAPDFLLRNAARWNQQWADLKSRNSGASFQWYKFEGQPVNQKISPLLAALAQEHCAYCDAFPNKSDDDTIDHFKPKSDARFLLLAYEWTNLYSACGHCQKEKWEQFSELLLRPDADDYTFGRYFVYNYSNHEIDINPNTTSDEQERARMTICIFNFNHPGQVTARRQSWERWWSPKTSQVLEDFAFRFIFEEAGF